MKYLLDTCCVSDFIKGNENTMMKIKSSAPTNIAISSITTMEIAYGLQLNPDRTKKIKPLLNDFLSCVRILALDENEAKLSAQLRAELKAAGTPIGSYDILIAATAIAHNLTLITSNMKEFKRVSNLKIEDWR